MSLCCLGFSTQISPSSSRQPPLPKSVHFVNNFLRKLFTFVAPELSWPPLGSPNRCFPRCLVQSKEKCDDSYTLRSGILRLTPRRLKILRPPGLSWPRSRQPPLPTSVHFVNNFLRKLFNFVPWAPLPISPLPDPGSHPFPDLFILLTIS